MYSFELLTTVFTISKVSSLSTSSSKRFQILFLSLSSYVTIEDRHSQTESTTGVLAIFSPIVSQLPCTLLWWKGYLLFLEYLKLHWSLRWVFSPSFSHNMLYVSGSYQGRNKLWKSISYFVLTLSLKVHSICVWICCFFDKGWGSIGLSRMVYSSLFGSL